MSVYVDGLRDYGTAWLSARNRSNLQRSASCHMVADTLDELHAMAKAIGLRRDWFQNAASAPHYDLTPRRREAAVKAGAVEVDRAGFVAVIRRLRAAKAEEPTP